MRNIGLVMRKQMIVLTLGLAACSPSSDENEAGNQAAVDPYAPADNIARPDDRTPLEEPNGPIDPKSVEAAGQVVQSYGALIEQRRFAEAEKLWRESPKTRLFTDDFRRNRETHLAIEELGEPHGAAGSIYVTMPVTFYGKDAAGANFRQPAVISLRRVNDVPGSTEAQRRWHIDDLTFIAFK